MEIANMFSEPCGVKVPCVLCSYNQKFEVKFITYGRSYVFNLGTYNAPSYSYCFLICVHSLWSLVSSLQCIMVGKMSYHTHIRGPTRIRGSCLFHRLLLQFLINPMRQYMGVEIFLFFLQSPRQLSF